MKEGKKLTWAKLNVSMLICQGHCLIIFMKNEYAFSWVLNIAYPNTDYVLLKRKRWDISLMCHGKFCHS